MLPQSGLVPDKYVLLKIQEAFFILSGFHGGYLNGDAWRRSTEIETASAIDNSDSLMVTTISGSKYILNPHNYGFTNYSRSVYESLYSHYEAVEEEEAKKVLESLKNKLINAQ